MKHKYMKHKYLNTELLVISIVTIVGTFLFGYISFVLHREATPDSFISIWNTWDTQHYIRITEHGYGNEIIRYGEVLIAFFPFYPLLIKISSFIFKDYLLSGLIVSNISYIVAVFYLYKLVLLDYDKDDAFRSIIYFSIFPTAYFLHAAYTESLFIALTVASFYYARKERWAISGILGMLSALTRITGIIILPILLVEYLYQKRFRKENIRKDVLWLFVIGLGFLIYLIINYVTFGDPFQFLEVQKQNWKMKLSPATTGFLTALSYLGADDINKTLNQGWFQIVFAILGLGLTVYSFFRIRLSYSLYALANWLILTSTSFWISVPRFMLTLFPIFIVLALLGRRKEVNYVIIFLSLMLYCLFLSEFVIFRWAF